MNLNSLFVKSIGTRLQIINYQTVRGVRVRKPFWLGIAKSKKFIVREEKKDLNPEEEKVFMGIKSRYNEYVDSILDFMTHEDPNLLLEKTGKVNLALQQDISESLASNLRFNEESARRREERMKKLMEEENNKAIEIINAAEENRKKQLEIIEDIVRKEKVLSESYVTPENVDEAIEKCLNTLECCDFAVDLNGKRYHGRESLKSREELNAFVQKHITESLAVSTSG